MKKRIKAEFNFTGSIALAPHIHQVRSANDGPHWEATLQTTHSVPPRRTAFSPLLACLEEVSPTSRRTKNSFRGKMPRRPGNKESR